MVLLVIVDACTIRLVAALFDAVNGRIGEASVQQDVSNGVEVLLLLGIVGGDCNVRRRKGIR